MDPVVKNFFVTGPFRALSDEAGNLYSSSLSLSSVFSEDENNSNSIAMEHHKLLQNLQEAMDKLDSMFPSSSSSSREDEGFGEKFNISGISNSTGSTSSNSNSCNLPSLVTLSDLVESVQYLLRTAMASGSFENGGRNASFNLSPGNGAGSLIKSHSHAINVILWVFVAKCSVLVNALLVQEISRQYMRLGEDAGFWESIIDSSYKRIYLDICTLPQRLVQTISNTGGSSLWSRFYYPFFSGFGSWSWLWNWRKSYRRYIRKSRLEACGHLNSVNHVRNQLSIALGVLYFKQRYKHDQFGMVDNGGALKGSSSSSSSSSNVSVRLEKLKRSVAQTLVLSREILSQDELEDVSDISQFKVREGRSVISSPGDALTMTGELLELLDEYPGFLQEVTRRSRKPTPLVWYWAPVTVAALGLFQGRKSQLLKPSFWTNLLRSLSITVHNFIRMWIIDPLWQVWSTVRYRERNLTLLLGSQTLESDLQSLERMVVDYAKSSSSSITQSQLDRIISETRAGDLTLVYRRYEDEIQAPLRNIVAGDLVRLLLIQIQKSKVDLEVAMTALDKLLKANELNFAMLTVIPAAFAFVWGLRQVSVMMGARRQGGQNRIIVRIRRSLDSIERILLLVTSYSGGGGGASTSSNRSSNSNTLNSLSPRQQGSLLLHLITLEALFSELSHIEPGQRRLLIEAARDLAILPNVSTKLIVMNRIYQAHGNIFNSSN